MLKAYRYSLRPNRDQIDLLNKHFGHTRHVYNWALGLRQKHYAETGQTLSMKVFFDGLVTDKRGDKPWLGEVNSQSLQMALRNLDTAYTNFFEGRAKLPKFKSRKDGWQSFHCPQFVMVDFAAGRIKLPKISPIRAFLHREFDGRIKTVTIKRSPTGHYFASVLVDDGLNLPAAQPVTFGETIGLDVGINHYLIDSDGTKVENPKYLKASLARLAVEQRKLSRKKKSSHNREKQKRVVARVHERVANRRRDFIHQLTARLVNKNQVTGYAVETLNIKGMLRNKKLARTIADCAWSRFIDTLQYKCDWSGKTLLPINRFVPSSKTCSCCHHKMPALPLSVRDWHCPECGAQHDRDINAAINIKHFALADTAGLFCLRKEFPGHNTGQRLCDREREQKPCSGSQDAPTITTLVDEWREDVTINTYKLKRKSLE
jgi:putative transposase